MNELININSEKLKIKRLDKRAIIPTKEIGDSGYDFYGIFDKDFVAVEPQKIIIIKSGFAFEIPENFAFILKERSSTGSKGIGVRSGVMDSSYRGEYMFAINNTSDKTIVFAKYTKGAELDVFLEESGLVHSKITIHPQNKAICQGILVYTPHLDVVLVDELSDSSRNSGSFGSTNK